MTSRRQFLSVSAAGAACAAAGFAPRALAQLVGKATRMVVGFPPGGSADVVARLVVDQTKGYAATIIVDNKPGAGGRIALENVKNAEADGATMVLTPASMLVIYPHVYRKLAYDPFRDFAAVTTACSSAFLLSVGPAVPATVKTLADFLQWCKANPKEASYGSSGAGSMPHFTGVMLGAGRRRPAHARRVQGRCAGDAGPARRPDRGEHQRRCRTRCPTSSRGSSGRSPRAGRSARRSCRTSRR